MSYFRALLALSLSGLACAAIAPCALAREGGPTHQFTGTVTSEVSVQGLGQEEFDFGPLNIKCNAAKASKGAPRTTFPALKFVVAVKFGKCKTAEVKVAGETLPPEKAEFNQPLQIEYRAGGEPNAEIKNPTTVQVAIPKLECTVSWAKSTSVSEQVDYLNVEEKAKSAKRFPLGLQDMVQIDNVVETIGWSASGGACGKFGKGEGKTGEYSGNLLAELKSGDLGWE